MHCPLKGTMASFPGVIVGLFAELSHPTFCSARERTARAALLGGHALDVVEGLTVRMQRVHVEMLKSFRSAVVSEVASSLASFAGRGGGRVWRAPSCQSLPLALLLKL